jgi:hypothetical protein
MDHPGALPERRAEDRRRVLRGATLTFNKGYGAFECTVRNQSPTGARLRFGETSAVPAFFDLQISGEGVRRQARVRWRNLTDVGVSWN